MQSSTRYSGPSYRVYYSSGLRASIIIPLTSLHTANTPTVFCTIPLQTVYQVIGESLSVEASDDNYDQRLCHNFQLFTAPPMRVFPRDGTSLRESNAQAPACILHLRWERASAQPVKNWAKNLEDSISEAMSGLVHPRVQYSSRCVRHFSLLPPTSPLSCTIAAFGHYLLSSSYQLRPC